MKHWTYNLWNPDRSQRRRCDRAGFTMLEILLAMTILVIIMLMLTTMFDQSATTWESGIRETSRALEGRTIINLIAADLELAVMNPELYGYRGVVPVQIGGSELCFHYRDQSVDGHRALRAVRYVKNGAKLQRWSWTLNPTPGNPYSPTRDGTVDLLDNVNSFAVFTPGNVTFTTNLPEWVDIELKLSETANAASDIQVWSLGPNRAGGGDDDVVE